MVKIYHLSVLITVNGAFLHIVFYNVTDQHMHTPQYSATVIM